jgi:hypothetical protein
LLSAEKPVMKKNQNSGSDETVTRDSIADIWGKRTPYYGGWPERIDEFTEEKPDSWVRSACVL